LRKELGSCSVIGSLAEDGLALGQQRDRAAAVGVGVFDARRASPRSEALRGARAASEGSPIVAAAASLSA
jgi:hypothetical protein